MKRGRKKRKKTKKKAGAKISSADDNVAAQHSVPIEEVASRDLAEWSKALEFLMGSIKSKIMSLKPVDKDALELSVKISICKLSRV